MGKFKTGLLNLKKSVEDVDPAIEDIYGKLTPTLNTLTNSGMRFSGGYEHAYMYLVEKFKTKNTTFDANLDMTLRDVLDKELAMYIKEIEDARAKAIATRKTYDALREQLKTLVKQNDGIKIQITALEASLAKKKKRLIKTKSYKAKVAGYEKTLNELADIVKQWSSMLTNPPKVLVLKFLNSSGLTVATTMREIQSTAGLQAEREVHEAENNAVQDLNTFRAKRPKACLAQVKSWVEEADEMEAESEEAT